MNFLGFLFLVFVGLPVLFGLLDVACGLVMAVVIGIGNAFKGTNRA